MTSSEIKAEVTRATHRAIMAGISPNEVWMNIGKYEILFDQNEIHITYKKGDVVEPMFMGMRVRATSDSEIRVGQTMGADQ
jgi:hypothetical protein